MKFLTDPADFIMAVVETLLPRGSDPNMVLNFNFEVETECKETWESEVRQVHLVFHRPGNYTKVLWHVGDVTGAPRFGVTYQFDLRANHDSAWREDGVRSPLSKLMRDLEEGLLMGKSVESPSFKRSFQFDFLHPFKLRRVARLEQVEEDERVYEIEFV